MASRDDLLSEFDNEMATTRKLLERVPDGKFDFKPHEKSGNMGWLANHVATLPDFATVICASEMHDFGKDSRPKEAASRKELLEAFEKSSKAARSHLEKLNDESLAKIWSLEFNGQNIFTMPRKMALRGPFMNHLIHHRAQLGVYLRMNNVPLPWMYGPTADEPFQPQQAAAKP